MASGTGKRSTKRKSPGRRNNRSKKKQQEAFRNEVILWIALAAAIILFVSNLGFGGVVGGMVSDFFFGVFGLLSYIVPILLFVGTAFLIQIRKTRLQALSSFRVLCLLSFCAFFSSWFWTGRMYIRQRQRLFTREPISPAADLSEVC